MLWDVRNKDLLVEGRKGIGNEKLHLINHAYFFSKKFLPITLI